MLGDLKRILVVEDEEDIRTVTSMALRHVGGFDVEMCESGEEALERCRASEPDLILLDVMLPGMDGPETLAALREGPDCIAVPVVFMTARAQSHEIERYKGLGALDVLTKPFDPMTLSDSIRALWRQYHASHA